jgi:hypothetical protein
MPPGWARPITVRLWFTSPTRPDGSIRGINLLINRLYASDAPIPVDVGKPIITFCIQRDDICSNGDETTTIIEDSTETFRAIEQLIESAH